MADRAPGISGCSFLELSRGALSTNVRYLQRTVGKATTLCAVIKGNAYGHGIDTFVPLAESCGLHVFAAFSAGEAWLAHQAASPGSRIQVMGYASDDEVDWAVDDRGRLERALLAARRWGRPARLHLELETGMYRTGLDPSELDAVMETLLEHRDQVRIAGVCSHLAGAESTANAVRIDRQLQAFASGCQRLALLGTFERHVASSAATLVLPDTRMDLVRVGIALYGYRPSAEIRMQRMVERQQATGRRWIDPLERVITWKSVVMSTKRVPIGKFVGYGNAHLTTRATHIAVVPVGYAYGFPRNLSNAGRVLVRGRPAPVVGVVGMNLMSVDVTDISGVQPGDEVVLIGKQGRRTISVASFADMAPLLNYEALARLPWNIPRTVTD